MNVQETLTQIDHIMTEVDLELYQWQTDLDMMSFIGVNATVELWTNDHPPRVVTKDVLSQAAGKELRVMHHIDGEWTKVGTAKVDAHGQIFASIDRDIPGITDGVYNHFSLGHDGGVRPLPADQNLWPDGRMLATPALGKPLTIRGLHEAIAKEEERNKRRAEIWNHEPLVTRMAKEAAKNEEHLSERAAARREWLNKTDTKLENHPFFDKEND